MCAGKLQQLPTVLPNVCTMSLAGSLRLPVAGIAAGRDIDIPPNKQDSCMHCRAAPSLAHRRINRICPASGALQSVLRRRFNGCHGW